jgi:uncharacterized protein
MTPPLESQPWYKHRWVWFIIAIPATSIVLGFSLLWISIKNADSLVADDYYREGRAINQRLEKDQAAAARGISIDAAIYAQPNGSRRIEARFSANPGTPSPELLRVRMSHPTFNERDVLLTLVKSNKASLYVTEVPELSSGRWYVMIEDENSQWRIRATWTVE